MTAHAAIAWYTRRLERPLLTAAHRHSERQGLLLRLVDGDLVGWGEAAPLAGHADAPLGDVREQLADLVRAWPRIPTAAAPPNELRPSDVVAAMGELVRRTGAGPHAAGAFGTAWSSLAAAASGQPLFAWLSASSSGSRRLEPNVTAVSPSVLVNAVIGGGTLEAAVAEARRAVADGYRTLKLKVGVDGSADAVRVAAVRAAVGPKISIRLDANGVWATVAEALHRIEPLAAFDIQYIEQPVAAKEVRALAELRRLAPVPVAADESLLEDGGPEEVAEQGAADVWVIKPTLCGGALEGVRLASLAERSGAKVVVTTALESCVGRTAAMHVAAAVGTPGMAHGLAADRCLSSDHDPRPWRISNGTATMAATPGLGLSRMLASTLNWRVFGAGEEAGSLPV